MIERFGFDPQTEAKRLNKLHPSQRIREFIQQRESYKNHLIEDQAVSIPYSYWLNEGEIFTSSSFEEIYNIKYQIDQAERNGTFYSGLLKAAMFASVSPGELIALYSPTGKKLFDNTPVEGIPQGKRDFLKKPYDSGQLYFMYFDGQKLNNVSISIDNDNNPWLLEMAPEISFLINNDQDEERKISSIVNMPLRLGRINNFFDRRWANNHLVYHNVHHQDFYLDQVLSEMKTILISGKPVIVGSPDDRFIKSLEGQAITSQLITEGYLLALHNYIVNNEKENTTLGGSCGGGSLNLGEIELILELGDLLQTFRFPSPTDLISSFSSAYRNIKQWDYHDGECRICNTKTEVGPCKICRKCESKFN